MGAAHESRGRPLEQRSDNVAASTPGGQTVWPQWIAWVAAAFAVLSNVVGVAEVATANRLVLSLCAGGLAVAVGAFSLWRLFAQGGQRQVGTVIFALNLAMLLIGAGVLGGAVVSEWGPVPSGNGSLPITSTTAGAPATGPSTGAERSAAITIEFLFPKFGDTFAAGRDVNGRVAGIPVDAQIWLLVGPLRGAVLTPQGPCTTNGANWHCANVRLDGAPGSYVLTAVVASADVATTLRDTREVRAVPPGALASTQIVVLG
jgi:hypothetical protein